MCKHILKKKCPELSEYIDKYKNNKVSISDMINGIDQAAIVVNKSAITAQEAINAIHNRQEKV